MGAQRSEAGQKRGRGGSASEIPESPLPTSPKSLNRQAKLLKLLKQLKSQAPGADAEDSNGILHAAAAAWLSHVLVVVPPEEAPAGKRSGLRAREGDDQSESAGSWDVDVGAGEQPSRATSTQARTTDLFTTVLRKRAARTAH